jgi:transcriptional regulator with XRE-family HTH domain
MELPCVAATARRKMNHQAVLAAASRVRPLPGGVTGGPQTVRKSEVQAPVVSLFAAELVAARTSAGLSQEALGEKIHYSPSLIAMIENGRRAPRLDFAERLDEALQMPGTFRRLQQHARTTPLPSWFRPYAEVEAAATQLRSWQPLIIDGLLQTEPYARALLMTWPNTTPDDLEGLVSARMERQAVLARDDPPALWVVMDEGTIRREIGGPEVMRDQLLHLAAMAERPNITIEIVPFAAGAHAGLTAPYAIAEAADVARVGYLDTASEGYIIESQSVVNNLVFGFDHLRGEALTRRASRELILRRAGEYEPAAS